MMALALTPWLLLFSMCLAASPELNETMGGRPIIVFGCSVSANNQYYEQAESFYRKVFTKLGYRFSMLSLPRTRELAELKKGQLEGSCGRRFSPPYAVFPELVRVPVAIGTLSQVLLSRDATPGIPSLSDLPDGKRIAYVRGGITATEFVNQYPNLDPIAVVDAEVGIKMLAAGRVDYFLGISITTRDVLTRLHFDQKIYQHVQMNKLEIYPYLAPKARYLVEPLENAIKQQLLEQQKDYLFEF